MFERLFRNGYPHTLLLRQSRMHPSLVPLYGYHYQRHTLEIKSVEVSSPSAHNMFVKYIHCISLRKQRSSWSLSVWARTCSGGLTQQPMRAKGRIATGTHMRLVWSWVCAAGWSVTMWTLPASLYWLLTEDRCAHIAIQNDWSLPLLCLCVVFLKVDEGLKGVL